MSENFRSTRPKTECFMFPGSTFSDLGSSTSSRTGSKKSRKNLRRKKTPQSACLSRKGCVFFLKETKCKTRERKGCVFFFSEESRTFCS